MPRAGVHIFKLRVGKEYVVWGTCATTHASGLLRTYLIEVCSWRTGQVVSVCHIPPSPTCTHHADHMMQKIALGTEPVHVALLDDSYLLVTPEHQSAARAPHDLNIYSISQSAPGGPKAICTLRLPEQLEGAYEGFLLSFDMAMSATSSTLGGHFRPDPSLAMLVLTYIARGTHGSSTTRLLIPYATILAQVRAAASQQSETTAGQQRPSGPVAPPVPVPWQDWGARGCLRLRLHPARHHVLRVTPFGSRFPVVMYDDDRFRTGSIYVFDVNPLTARHRGSHQEKRFRT